ncbi:DNA helicase, partial [Tanacetum coccineum]
AKISNSETSSLAPGKSTQIDEIQSYVDGRFICPFEACWRIFDFLIHSQEPAMQILNVNLGNMHRVNFHERDRLDIIVNLPGKKKTTFTEWFIYKNENTDRDLFYFQMLLCHQKGCRSPIEVWTINGQMIPTYRAACEALGLLSDDKEWDITFQESAASATSSEIRVLFAQILIYCDVADPLKLLHFIRGGKTLNGFGKSVKDLGLELPPQHLLKDLENKLLMEEKNYKRDLLREDAAQSVPKLNHEQKKIYDLIISSATTEQQDLLFVYGHGGTKKTFLWKKIISSLRSQGKIRLEVASSGIASLLLPAGRTTHSRFKIPLELTDESLCHAKKDVERPDERTRHFIQRKDNRIRRRLPPNPASEKRSYDRRTNRCFHH